jgi:hypothetical protein
MANFLCKLALWFVKERRSPGRIVSRSVMVPRRFASSVRATGQQNLCGGFFIISSPQPFLRKSGSRVASTPSFLRKRVTHVLGVGEMQIRVDVGPTVGDSTLGLADDLPDHRTNGQGTEFTLRIWRRTRRCPRLRHSAGFATVNPAVLTGQSLGQRILGRFRSVNSRLLNGFPLLSCDPPNNYIVQKQQNGELQEVDLALQSRLPVCQIYRSGPRSPGQCFWTQGLVFCCLLRWRSAAL